MTQIFILPDKTSPFLKNMFFVIGLLWGNYLIWNALLLRSNLRWELGNRVNDSVWVLNKTQLITVIEEPCMYFTIKYPFYDKMLWEISTEYDFLIWNRVNESVWVHNETQLIAVIQEPWLYSTFKYPFYDKYFMRD